MKILITALLVVLIMTVSAYAADGMVEVKSSFGVKETEDRLESVLKEKGMTILMESQKAETSRFASNDSNELSVANRRSSGFLRLHQ